MFNLINTFEFSFDLNQILYYESIVIGFCDEFVQWNRDTFFKVNINKKIINNQLGNKDEICMLSSWNIKCGISQYSKNIVDALFDNKINTKVFPHTSDYFQIFSYIKNTACKTFIVQYEPSLISNFEELFKIIKNLKSFGTKIFFIIHSENEVLFKLDGIIDGFIYHKNNTLHFKKTKIFKIPMGVPVFEPKLTRIDYRKKYNIPENKLVISTLGFMFAWKNHANILAKLATYIKENSDIVVQYMTSFHSTNNGECIDEYNKISSIVKENGLENNFIHITDYIPQAELNERLYLSDIGFLWSGIETTSSSASLKEFVASRLPVVKTNSTHYHDISEGTITTEQNIDLFADAIIESINNKEKLYNFQLKMEENYKKLNYNFVINKFVEIIDV